MANEKIEQYIDQGSRILQLYRDDIGFILPPIFYHTAVENPDGENVNVGYKKHFKGIENEHPVHEALRNFSKTKPVIALHSLYFTRKDLLACGISQIPEYIRYTLEEEDEEVFHQGQKHATKDYEHDFVVIDLSCHRFVCVEVKSSYCEENIQSAKEQLHKIEYVIGQLFSGQSVEIVKVLAFPAVEQLDLQCIDRKYKVLCKGNIENKSSFSSWWKANISSLPRDADQKQIKFNRNSESVIGSIKDAENLKKQFDRVTKLLIGLWVDKEVEDYHSEIGMIQKIDKRLRDAVLYQGREGRRRNMTDEVAPTEETDPINLSGIKSLSYEQKLLLEDTQSKQCIIRGPAGSGKTILMLAKIINLCKKSSEKRLVVVITHQDDAIIRHQLEECGLQVKTFQLFDLISRNRILEYTCSQVIRDGESPSTKVCNTYEVVIIHLNTNNRGIKFDNENLRNVLENLKPFHLFVDNLQHKYFLDWNLAIALPGLAALSEYMWLLCDDMQHFDYDWLDFKTEHKFQNQIISLKEYFEEKTLERIIRNTLEISKAAIFMRANTVHENTLPDIECTPLHLIHGPIPQLYVTSAHVDVKLHLEQFIQRYHEAGSVAVLQYSGKRMEFPDFQPVFVDYVFNAVNYEFTSVIAVLDMNDVRCKHQALLEQWFYCYSYLVLSRARVVAEIVLIKKPKFNLDFNNLEKYFEVTLK